MRPNSAPGGGTRSTGPGVVLIDDAEMTKDCEAGEQLAEIVTFGAYEQRAVVCAWSPPMPGFGTWLLDAQSKHGAGRRCPRRTSPTVTWPARRCQGDLPTGGPEKIGRGPPIGGGKLHSRAGPSGYCLSSYPG